MKDNITIRQSNKKDIDAILQLYQQPEMDSGHAIKKPDAEELYARIEKYPFYRFYVACLDEEIIVGVFGLLIMDNIGHRGTASAIVEGVCVDKNHQNKGIGKKMMQVALKISQEYGCYKLALTSNIKREKAHQFYRDLGFDQHGISFQLEF